MEYIVLDMEWNQALNFSEMVKDPVFLTGEIIQIGAIKLNQTLEVVDSFNERIAPQYYTELHPKVAEITKLSNRDLQKGKGFHTVFNSFCDWCGDDFVFLVWGTEDLEEPYADIGDALSDDYVVSFECPHCGEIVWGENWIRKTGTNLLSLSQCSDGQEYLISLKFRPIAENKVVVKRLVYALTDELRTDYQQCMEQAAAWSKYVIPAYSF